MKIVSEINAYQLQDASTSTAEEVLEALVESKEVLGLIGVIAPHVVIKMLTNELLKCKNQFEVQRREIQSLSERAEGAESSRDHFKSVLSDVRANRDHQLAEKEGLRKSLKSAQATIETLRAALSDVREDLRRLRHDVCSGMTNHSGAVVSPPETRVPFPKGFSAESVHAFVVDYNGDNVVGFTSTVVASRKAKRMRIDDDDKNVVVYARVWPKTEALIHEALARREGYVMGPLTRKSGAEITDWLSSRAPLKLWQLFATRRDKVTVSGVQSAIMELVREIETCYGIS